MKNSTKYFLLLFSMTLLLFACDSKKESSSKASDMDVQFELPATLEVSKGGEYTFTVKDGKMPLQSDTFMVQSDQGLSYICPFVTISAESFTVRFDPNCETGYYSVFIKRESRKRPFGKIYVKVGEKLDFTPDEGTTVYGLVSSAEGGVANVVISDGEQVTTTNKDGIYQLRSTKKMGYVFISIPSGYEVPSSGVLPQFHKDLKGGASVVERIDFSLKAVTGQDTYKVFMFGDMHLANRTDDSRQFAEFTTDVTAYMNQHKGQKIYAITLGDMTWDLYWYSNSFYFPQYLTTINKQIKDLQIFHTMGNHDNDYMTTSDISAAVKYVDMIAPTYYSFNLGKVHYIVLDDIDCSSYDGTDSRNYAKRLTNEQLSWLAKDLSYVDKTTPLVITMHAQLFYPVEGSGYKIDHDAASTNNLLTLLDGYQVHFVTGHTHMIFNVTNKAAIVGGKNFQEHNSGSICASWWWSDNLTSGVHVGIDGTPGGYGIWDVTGTDFKWLYKSTGWPVEYQFRSYDLNNVHFSKANVPLMPSGAPAEVQNAYKKYMDAYPEGSQGNEVLINIWNWNDNWTLKVTDESGSAQVATPVWAYDPLHIAALSVPRFNNANLKSVPSFITEKFCHFFKVKLNDATTDLTITVKDEFGNTWTENMQRPKAFSTDAYKRK